MGERFAIWLAWRLPKPLVYWAAVRLMSHATVGLHSNQVVSDLSALAALQRWSK